MTNAQHCHAGQHACLASAQLQCYQSFVSQRLPKSVSLLVNLMSDHSLHPMHAVNICAIE